MGYAHTLKQTEKLRLGSHNQNTFTKYSYGDMARIVTGSQEKPHKQIPLVSSSGI